jgi:bifunctional UDP-N-acetylglucosamine pyrophosphorylase/glucosamine-1-phosphate N-acetyltransferase
MSESIGIVILAAGIGTRLKQKTPKPLLKILGKSLLDYIIDGANDFVEMRSLKAGFSVVVGHEKELVIDSLATREGINFPIQKQQNGTAGALLSYFESVEKAWDYDYTLILCADTPLISGQELDSLYSVIESGRDAVAATFRASNPSGFGRIIKSGSGFKIVEEKDADADQKKIEEVNSGLYIIKTSYLKKHLSNIDNKNASGEFYLTDIFKVDENVEAVEFENSDLFLGVNTLVQLEDLTQKLRVKKNNTLMHAGIHIMSSGTTFIDYDVEIEAGSIIHPNVSIWGNTKIGSGVVIQPNSVIDSSIIHNDVVIKANSILEGAEVFAEAVIGPFSRLRPGASVGEKSKIGNFVEIKKSQLSKGVKVSHLSYIGDAEIGDDTNIGCGFITCNYDGANKHLTKIGSGTFIGSDCQAVAPVNIGSDSFVAAGSTITSDIPDGGFGIARTKQTTKEGMAKRFLKKK